MSYPQQHFRFRIAIVAAFALLLAQLGAMTHAYSHVPQAQSAKAQQPSPNAHDYCADCLNFAPLLAAAAAAPALPFTAPPANTAPLLASPSSRLELPLQLAFRSRAPPPVR